MDEQSGIIAAKLSKDEKFILFTAVTHRRNSETEPLQTRNYQLNTESLNMLTYDGKALDPPPAKKDTVKVQKPRPRVEESSEASAESATGTETTVIPAAEPQQTEPKPAEPKPAEPAPAPKTQENTTTSSE
jgi:hypothetical protein